MYEVVFDTLYKYKPSHVAVTAAGDGKEGKSRNASWGGKHRGLCWESRMSPNSVAPEWQGRGIRRAMLELPKQGWAPD